MFNDHACLRPLQSARRIVAADGRAILPAGTESRSPVTLDEVPIADVMPCWPRKTPGSTSTPVSTSPAWRGSQSRTFAMAASVRAAARSRSNSRSSTTRLRREPSCGRSMTRSWPRSNGDIARSNFSSAISTRCIWAATRLRNRSPGACVLWGRAESLYASQGATLGGLIRFPSLGSLTPSGAVQTRRDRILRLMHDHGWLTAAATVTSWPHRWVSSRITRTPYNRFVNDVFGEALTLPALGRNPSERRARLERGDFTLETTADLNALSDAGRRPRICCSPATLPSPLRR